MLRLAAILLAVTSASPSSADAVRILLVRPGQLNELVYPGGVEHQTITLRALLDEAASQSAATLRIVEQVPFARALREAEESTDPVCIPMILDRPERRGYLRYSGPVQAYETIIVAHRRNDYSFGKYADFDSLLADPKQTLAWRTSVSYGDDLKGRLDKAKPNISEVSSAGTTLPVLVAGGRASYFLTSRSMWASSMPSLEPTVTNELVITYLPSAPEIPPLYVGCNESTPDKFLASITEQARLASEKAAVLSYGRLNQ